MEDMKASWELSQSQISQEKAQSDKLKDTLAQVSLERAQQEEVIKTLEKNQSGQVRSP